MRITRLIVPIAIAALVLTACGNKKDTPQAPVSSAPVDNGIKALSADEILTKAVTAVVAAGSFRVKGDMEADGQKITVDLKTKGTDGAGTIAMATSGSLKLVRIGNDVYIQGDPAFWKTFGGAQGELISTLFKDKWVKAAADNASFAPYASLANPQSMLKPDGVATKGDEKTVNGQATIGIKDSKDDATIYIATTGKPYPVRLEGPAGKGGLDFTEFGATFDDIKAPPADQVVDLSAFIGK